MIDVRTRRRQKVTAIIAISQEASNDSITGWVATKDGMENIQISKIQHNGCLYFILIHVMNTDQKCRSHNIEPHFQVTVRSRLNLG